MHKLLPATVVSNNVPSYMGAFILDVPCISAVPILKHGAVSLQDKSEADVERIKATVLLCYGYVTYHSPAK